VEDAPAPSADAALLQFHARPDEPVSSYRVKRTLRGSGLGKRAEMEVLVELDEERGFQWTAEAVFEPNSVSTRAVAGRGIASLTHQAITRAKTESRRRASGG
jgi:hypothetical protein